ncbi:MAG: hypothetical protein U0165_19315 [Polyangiaceae bacterium]
MSAATVLSFVLLRRARFVPVVRLSSVVVAGAAGCGGGKPDPGKGGTRTETATVTSTTPSSSVASSSSATPSVRSRFCLGQSRKPAAAAPSSSAPATPKCASILEGHRKIIRATGHLTSPQTVGRGSKPQLIALTLPKAPGPPLSRT